MADAPTVWVSIKDAATLAHRAERTVYSWVDKGYLVARRSSTGVLQVRGADLLQVESKVRTGRPRGSARPIQNATRRTDVLDESMQKEQDEPRQSISAPETEPDDD